MSPPAVAVTAAMPAPYRSTEPVLRSQVLRPPQLRSLHGRHHGRGRGLWQELRGPLFDDTRGAWCPGAVALGGCRVNDSLSVGTGVSIIYTLFEQQIALNPALIPTVNGGDGYLNIDAADDVGLQPFFSLNYALSEDLLLGVVYRAEMDVELSGDLELENVALPVGADSIDIDWKNPQWLEVGLKYSYTDRDTFYLNAGWQDWSEFSNNQLAFSGEVLDPIAELDRNWKDTWHAGIAHSHRTARGSSYSLGFSYDSSPVDEIFKLSAAYAWKGHKDLDFSIGGTLYLVGDAAIDDRSQRVQTKGEFDSNAILFLGGTLRYIF